MKPQEPKKRHLLYLDQEAGKVSLRTKKFWQRPEVQLEIPRRGSGMCNALRREPDTTEELKEAHVPGVQGTRWIMA